MRALLFLCIASFLQLARSDDISPFHTALSNEIEELVKRQNGCPDGYNSCALLGARDACCQPDTICSRDAANNIACCPSGAECTGIVPTETDGGGQVPSSTGFRFPQPGTESTTSPPSTASTVPNALFPFTYIPTTFNNEAECAQSYTGCRSQYSRCTASLGGVNGVTVGGNSGYGITVDGVVPTADPQSVCSSLLNEACHGLHIAYCTAFGDNGSSGNWAAASTRTSTLYEILTGLVIALAGMVA
ncbi:hypothetical protein VTO42DRAFT_2423 [Malbranchea cinnamomea]